MAYVDPRDNLTRALRAIRKDVKVNRRITCSWDLHGRLSSFYVDYFRGQRVRVSTHTLPYEPRRAMEALLAYIGDRNLGTVYVLAAVAQKWDTGRVPNRAE